MSTIDWTRYPTVRTTRAFPVPPAFDPKRFSHAQLHRAASGASILFRGWSFIVYSKGKPFNTHNISDGIETTIDAAGQRPGPTVEQWTLLRSGAFLHRILMREELDPRAEDMRRDGRRVLNTMETIYHVAEAIGSLWRLYDGLGVPNEESVTVEFSYHDTEGRELVVLDPRRSPMVTKRLCYAPRVEVARTFALWLWKAGDVQAAVEICEELFEHFQWEPGRQHLEDEIRPFLGKPRAFVTV